MLVNMLNYALIVVEPTLNEILLTQSFYHILIVNA
jgi:hypothetical protein